MKGAMIVTIIIRSIICLYIYIYIYISIYIHIYVYTYTYTSEVMSRANRSASSGRPWWFVMWMILHVLVVLHVAERFACKTTP